MSVVVGVRSFDRTDIGIAVDHLTAFRLWLDHHGVQRRRHVGEMDDDHHEQTNCRGECGPQ